jgi:hypothetical protein
VGQAAVDAVAYVADTPIPKARYTHWRAIEAALGTSGNLGQRALGFLITSEWVIHEARAKRIVVSQEEAQRYLAQSEKIDYHQTATQRKSLTAAGETQADLLLRAQVVLLKERIAAAVAGASTGARREAVLASFQRSFQQHWRSLTFCEPDYVFEDCAQFKGRAAGGGQGAPASASSSSSGSPSTPKSYTPTPGNFNAEVPAPQGGAMAIESPAFARNGLIPARYSCDGAGISPPLRWHNVPRRAAALVLFVIDQSSIGASGGIRWTVANISPSTTGVGAGGVPTGGVVGANTQGQASYGAICPAPGTIDKIEFVLYALRKPLDVSSGFAAILAERQYAAERLLLGEPAITYAGYARP